MITDVEYMQIVTEEYDLSDFATKKKVLFCNEANKALNIEHIVTRLYTHIKNDSTGIDFGSIPKSKGDITKVENYEQMLDCLNSISELVKNYKDPTTVTKEIYTAIDNIHNREREFTKAYTLNIEAPIMTYNMTVLAIISSISLLISSSIEFIKNGHDSFTVAFDKIGFNKSKDHLMFEYVTQFNRNCANGTIDKIIRECIKNNLTATNESAEVIDEGFKDTAKSIIGTAIDAGSLAAGVATAVKSASKLPGVLKVVGIIIGAGVAAIGAIKMTAKAVYFFLKMKMKLSDWFAVQAQYLQINAENLKYRDDEDCNDDKKEVYQRQMKWVDRFKAISNALAIKDSKARKETEEEESKRRQYEDDSEDSDDGLF